MKLVGCLNILIPPEGLLLLPELWTAAGATPIHVRRDEHRHVKLNRLTLPLRKSAAPTAKACVTRLARIDSIK